MMKDLREKPFTTIAGSKVIAIEDYASSERRDMIEGTSEAIDIPKSNVLIYYTEDGAKIAARPSGTEPKIKFYISVHTSEASKNTSEVLQKKIADIRAELNNR